MIRQTQTELDARLATKTLDQALLTQLQQQFGRSPFESRAILEVVKETYLGQLRTPSTLKPGQMVVLAIKADEPPGKPLKECQFVPIVVTVHTSEDNRLRQGAGRQAVAQVRRVQLERMAWEAVAQETYLTVEDLAYRILNCGTRTIEGDLAYFRRNCSPCSAWICNPSPKPVLTHSNSARCPAGLQIRRERLSSYLPPPRQRYPFARPAVGHGPWSHPQSAGGASVYGAQDVHPNPTPHKPQLSRYPALYRGLSPWR
jgi:hypothetical protein